MSYDNRFVTTIDVPVEQDVLYDYDDMYGIVDDKINPSDNEEHTPTLSLIEILGGRCTICPENNKKLLTIHSIRDYKANRNPKYVRQLVEEAIRRGKNPNKDFRALCHSCDIRMKEIKKFRKDTGLTELSQDKLEQGLRTIYT